MAGSKVAHSLCLLAACSVVELPALAGTPAELPPPARLAQPMAAVPLGQGNVYPQGELAILPAAAAGAAASSVARTNAEDELSGWVHQQYADFEMSKEMGELNKAETKAYEEYQRVRNLVLGVLAKDVDYAAIATQRHTTEARIAGEKSHGASAHVSEIESLVLYRSRLSAEMTRRESVALANDTEVLEARQKMLDAAAAVRDRRQAFQRQLRSDDAFKVAVRTVRQARVDQAAARAYYAQAIEVAGAALDYAYVAQSYTPYHPRPETYYPVTGYSYGGYGAAGVSSAYSGAVYVRP